jgi:hypothetical protein
MEVLRPLFTVLMLVCTSACSAVGKYEYSNVVFGESIEIRRDGTFTYSCASDEPGSDHTAEGSWSVDDSNMLVTIVESSVGPGSACLRFTRWEVTLKGLISNGGGQLLRRQ